jgi:hypothetical protein
MADHYGNLGILSKERDDFAGARENWTKSRDLFGKIRAQEKVDLLQQWIDALPP